MVSIRVYLMVCVLSLSLLSVKKVYAHDIGTYSLDGWRQENNMVREHTRFKLPVYGSYKKFLPVIEKLHATFIKYPIRINEKWIDSDDIGLIRPEIYYDTVVSSIVFTFSLHMQKMYVVEIVYDMNSERIIDNYYLYKEM